MTKVAFVVNDLAMGGAERHIVTLAPAINRGRFDVSIFCLDQPGALFDDVRASGVEAHCLHGGPTWRGGLRAAFRLWRSFRRDRPDVVVTSGFRAGFLGRTVGRLAGVRASISWKHNIGHLGLVGVKERLSERALAPLTTRYLGVCFTQVRYLVDDLGLDPGRIGVVYNSIPTTAAASTAEADPAGRASLGLADTDLVVGIVAVLREEKDHASLLRAIAELRGRSIPVTLVIVGDGPRRPALEDLAAQLGISAHVRFLGQRSDVARLLPHFDVVALSSVTVECFPYAILEAMAAGRPVVATCVGGLAEMIEDGITGYLVPPGAPSAMADALADILADRDKATRFGAAGRARVDRRWPFAKAVTSVESEIVKVMALSGSAPGGGS